MSALVLPPPEGPEPGPEVSADTLRAALEVAERSRDSAGVRLRWAMDLHAQRGLWPTPMVLETLVQVRATEETLWVLQVSLLRHQLAELGEL